MGVGLSPPLGGFGNFLVWYCVFLEGKMLSVFGVDFLWVLPLRFFGFLPFYSCQVPFWKITLQSNFSDLLIN